MQSLTRVFVVITGCPGAIHWSIGYLAIPYILCPSSSYRWVMGNAIGSLSTRSSGSNFVADK
eukprot:1306080-Prorocentrum_lima.AAC.1